MTLASGWMHHLEFGAEVTAKGRPKTTSPSVTICLPWIGHSSTTLGKEIRQAITKGYPKVTPRTIFTTNKVFSGRAKDVLPMLSKSNVVYEFTCCCGQTYIGKTIQRLIERAMQHPAFQALHGGARSEDPQVWLGHHKTCEAEHLVPGWEPPHQIQAGAFSQMPRSPGCPGSAIHPRKKTNLVSTKRICVCFVPCLMRQI